MYTLTKLASSCAAKVIDEPDLMEHLQAVAEAKAHFAQFRDIGSSTGSPVPTP
jgi:hypothetical protein